MVNLVVSDGNGGKKKIPVSVGEVGPEVERRLKGPKETMVFKVEAEERQSITLFMQLGAETMEKLFVPVGSVVDFVKEKMTLDPTFVSDNKGNSVIRKLNGQRFSTHRCT